MLRDGASRPLSMRLVIIPRHAHRLGDTLVLHRGFQHHAFVKLRDHRALDFLPRRLAPWISIAAMLLQIGAALRDFGISDEDVRGTLLQVYAHAITRSQKS